MPVLTKRQVAQLALYLKTAGIDVLPADDPARGRKGFVTFLRTNEHNIQFEKVFREEVGHLYEYIASPEEVENMWINNNPPFPHPVVDENELIYKICTRDYAYDEAMKIIIDETEAENPLED